MEACPICHSVNIRLKASLLSRILVSTYILLGYIFLSGEVNFIIFIFIIPYIFISKYTCSDCKRIMYPLRLYKTGVRNPNNLYEKYLLTMLPSMLLIALLVALFPNTGLGRIYFLPYLYILNSAIIIIFLKLCKNINSSVYRILRIIIIVLTLVLTISNYPQESGVDVLNIIYTKLSNII